MNKTAAILNAENDRAQTAAQVILSSLAAVCTVGVIWAVGQHRGGPAGAESNKGSSASPFKDSHTNPNAIATPATQPQLSAPPISNTGLSPNGPFSQTGIASNTSNVHGHFHGLHQSPTPPFPGSSQSFNRPLSPPPQSPTSTASTTNQKPSLPAGRELKNPQIIEAVEAARLARQAGDTVMALESLRTADLRQPQHPEIISEMALTYEALSLLDRAKGLWRSVLAMGEAQAGGYYHLAKAKLEHISTPLNSTVPSPIQLGQCDVIREPLPAGGERVTIRVPIQAKPGSIIDPSRMDIHVFLFEQINDGERIEQVRAEEPEQKWISEPIDWTSPEGETLDIIYDLAAPTPEELRSLGNRSFHGYIVKLFYQDKLSGEQSHPPTLQDFPPRSHPPGLDNALFPK